MDDSPYLVLLMLLCLNLCIGLSWSHSLQQSEDDVVTKAQAIPVYDAKTLAERQLVDPPADSSSKVLAVDSINGEGKAPKDKATESQIPSVLENHVKQARHNGNSDVYDGDSIQGIHHGKPMSGQNVAFLPLEKTSTVREPLYVQFSEENVIEEAVQALEGRTSRTVKSEDVTEDPREIVHIGKSIQGGEQIEEIRVKHERKAIHKCFFSKMLAALSNRLHRNTFFSEEGGLLSSLKHLFAGAQNYVRNWFSSSNQKRTPTIWSYTEPVAIVEPVPPVMVYPQCNLKGRMLSALRQAMLDFRSSATSSSEASCAGKIEEAAVKLREAVSSQLKQSVCSKIDSPCEKEFCDFLQSKPKLTSLMVLSRFGINPVAVALSHSMDSGFCESSTEVSHIVDTIHHVTRLGHRIRERLSSRDLHNKGLRSGIKFWKSMFTGNRNSCKDCFHQVVHNVKKVMKHQLAITCHQPRCPKLVSTCSFAKEYKDLVRMLLMLKLQPWRFAAHSCTAENSCSSLSTILSHVGTSHKMDKVQLPHPERVDMIETHSPSHHVSVFLAIRRPSCRKAMLLRQNPMGLFQHDHKGNPQLPYNTFEFLFIEPVQIKSHVPERYSDDSNKVISRAHKFHPDISHEVHESIKHALNILDEFPGGFHHQEAEGSLSGGFVGISHEEFYRRIHDVLASAAREDVQLQAAGGNKSSTSEKQEIHHEIQHIAGNQTSSLADM